MTDAAFFFHVGRIGEASDLVERYHYSHRVPANVQSVGTWHREGGIFGDAGHAEAACFFSIPPTRWLEDVWELSRLVKSPDCSLKLSSAIGQIVSWVKKTGSIDLLVSYADATQGHHGGIY